MRRGFREADGTGNRDRVYLLSQEIPQFLFHLNRQIGPGIIHCEKNAFHVQLRVETLFRHFNAGHQVCQPFQRVILALHRDQNRICSHQGIYREKLEGRRAVDENKIVVLIQGPERIAEHGFSLLRQGQFHRGGGQIPAGGNDIAVFRLLDAAENVFLPNKQIIGTAYRVLTDAEAGSGVPLRITVHKKDSLSGEPERSAEIDGGGRFPDAALLICNCCYFCHSDRSTSYFCFLWNYIINMFHVKQKKQKSECFT